MFEVNYNSKIKRKHKEEKLEEKYEDKDYQK